MKKLVLLIGTLLCCAIANGRPQFIEPIRQLDANADLYQADVDGDWILARGLYATNIDPNDPVWSFDWWEKVVVFHRAASGEWQLVQTLADQYVIFNSDEHFADPRDLVLENGVAAFSTNSGLHVFELVSGTWVRRTVVGTLERPPFDLDFDGVTLFAWDGSCATAATPFTRQADGRWVAQPAIMSDDTECEEYFRREIAVSGSRALVYDDTGWQTGSGYDLVRVFERSGGIWQHVGALQPPTGVNEVFGSTMALRGDVALAGGLGTNVYRREGSGFTHTGKIPLTVWALDRPYASDLAIGPHFALQTYPGPSTTNDVAVLLPNTSGSYDHAAILGAADAQWSLNISGRRAVSTGGGHVNVYDLPQTFTPGTSTVHDFENGTQGWTALAGQFATAQRGATRVYRQSSLAGDAVAVNSADLETTLITADVRPTAFDGATRWVGLMARYIDENNHYYLTIRANNTVSIRKKVNGVITDLATYYPQVQVGTNYRASFEVVGNRLTYYLNGERLIDALDPDNSLPHGRTGVRTYRATADFDNVIITPAPLFELGGGPYFSHISMFDVIDGAWTTGGIFEIYQASTAGDARILHGSPTDDQVVRVSASIDDVGPQTTGSHWVGALVRYTDPSNYYYVTLRSSNELSLRKIVNGVITELARTPFTVQLGQPYRLRFEAIGTKLVVYVNDQVRLQASDSSHVQGRSGVVTYRAAASFTQYRSWQP